MQVRFTQDYQGQWTGPHFYLCGQEYDLDNVTAHLLIDDGRAVEVKPPAPIEPLPAQTVPMSKRARGGKRGDVL
jgi:hypothetical protein